MEHTEQDDPRDEYGRSLSTSGSRMRASQWEFSVILTWLLQRQDQEAELLCAQAPSPWVLLGPPPG